MMGKALRRTAHDLRLMISQASECVCASNVSDAPHTSHLASNFPTFFVIIDQRSAKYVGLAGGVITHQ
jgi:hypothetical protein